MRRDVLAAIVVIAAGSAEPAWAQLQPGFPFPKVEIGVHVTALDLDQQHFSGGPRLAVNFDDRTGVEIVFDLARPKALFHGRDLAPSEEYDADYVFVRLKRRVYGYAHGQMYATVGTGLSHVSRRYLPDPSLSTTRTYPVFAAGVGGDWRIAAPLTAFIEGELAIANEPGIRTAAGLMVAIGGYPRYSPLKSQRPPKTAGDPTGPWPPLRPGMRVRVMMFDEREYAGRLSNVTADRIDLGDAGHPMSIARANILNIRTPDPVTDGAIRGVKYGALTGAITGVLIAAFGCALEDCEGAGVTALLTVGLGMGIGASFGALVDGFHDHFVEVYQRPGTPAGATAGALARKAGVGGVIRW